jgi:hypothetical protein
MKLRDPARAPVVSLLTGRFAYGLAHGQDGDPYGLILGIAEITYLAVTVVALAFVRRRY